MSNVERTGWRDEWISRRHREWGLPCSALDIDFLLIEYRNGEPKALIEYKHHFAEIQDPKKPSYKALIKLGNCADIPVFGVRYDNNDDKNPQFTITPLNNKAKDFIINPNKDGRIVLNERDYVKLLYKIRGYDDSFSEQYLPGNKGSDGNVN